MSNQHVLGIIIPVLLIAFGIYRRVRRSIGFQPLVRRRLIIRMVFLCIAALLILAGALRHAMDVVGLVAGVVAGLILAGVAIRTTVFSYRNGKLHYRPHTWVGVTVLVLFLGRLAYRFVTIYSHPQLLQGGGGVQGHAGAPAMYGSDPLTIATMYLLVSYYVIYYAFLLRKRITADAGARTGNQTGETDVDA